MKTFKIILILLWIAATVIVLEYPKECKKYWKQYILREYTTEMIIPLELDKSGLYHITVKVNQVPMKFILDTGCSTMLISKTDANFLFNHDLIKKTNIGEKIKTIDANGNNNMNMTISIDEILLNNIPLKDIPCIISNENEIEPLLGQAVLKKLGKIIIDYENNTLCIRY